MDVMKVVDLVMKMVVWTADSMAALMVVMKAEK